MDEQLVQILNGSEESMKKSIKHLESELSKIRAGKANPTMLDGITVDYYGTQTPINQVGTVTVTDARTLTVQPWEKHMVAVIERAIMNANIGLNPSNDGELLRIPVPSLTEERRKSLVKQAKGEGENARVAVRKIRQDANGKIKGVVKGGVSEDFGKKAEKSIQDLTDKYGKVINDILDAKEKDIMTV